MKSDIYCCTRGGVGMELQDVLRVAGVGLVVALLHVFFDQTGKKEFSFSSFYCLLIYDSRVTSILRLFFNEILTFFQWLTSSG